MPGLQKTLVLQDIVWHYSSCQPMDGSLSRGEQKVARFNKDDTPGYSDAELSELNEAFEDIIAASPQPHADADDLAEKSWRDYVAEKLLARYDAGERGESLTR